MYLTDLYDKDIMDALPLTLDREALRAIDPRSVIIVKWPQPLRTKYYRNLLPDLQISICPECCQVNDLIVFFIFNLLIKNIL